MYTYDELIDFVREVKDPEVNASIVDIGLIYDITQDENMDVHVLLTLTSPQCPLGPEIIKDVERVLKKVNNVNNVEVELTFEPMWGPERFSDELKLEYGYPI